MAPGAGRPLSGSDGTVDGKVWQCSFRGRVAERQILDGRVKATKIGPQRRGGGGRMAELRWQSQGGRARAVELRW